MQNRCVHLQRQISLLLFLEMVGTDNQVSSLIAFPIRVLPLVLTPTNIFTKVFYKGI